MPPKTELWENASASSLTLKRWGPRDTLVGEMIRGHRKLEITPEERRMNQDAVYDSTRDPFTNGTLRPLRLIETEEDVAEIRDNPNTLGEAEMRGALANRKAHKALASKVGEITNAVTLQRFAEIAREEDATVNQLSIIQARLEEVNPSTVGAGSMSQVAVTLDPPSAT